MSQTGLDNRHRNKDGEISHKHGNTLIRTLRKVYGQSFAAGYLETDKLREAPTISYGILGFEPKGFSGTKH